MEVKYLLTELHKVKVAARDYERQVACGTSPEVAARSVCEGCYQTVSETSDLQSKLTSCNQLYLRNDRLS